MARNRAKGNDDSHANDQRRTIECPGNVWDSTIIEQIEILGCSSNYAIHEKMSDDSWRTREETQFPDPHGKGVLVPLKQVPWPLPGMPLDYESEKALFLDIVKFLQHHLELRNEADYALLTSFVLMTWRFEEFRAIPYLNFHGPKNTGKTRGLELLSSLCYRGWLITHPTPAAVFWITDRYHPTLLADNYEFWAKETRRELDGLFNAGYRRDATVPRRPREGERGSDLDIYKVYCPKVLSGIRGPSDALGQRCIHIRTTRARRPMPMWVDENWSRQLRSKLLQYRLRHLEKPMEESGETLNKYARVGEIFQSLLTIALDDEILTKLAGYAQGVFQDQLEEEATSEEAEVVRAMLTCKEQAVRGRLPTNLIVDTVNAERTEEDKVSPERVGWVLKRLGFKKARMQDAKGSRGMELDTGLLDHLVKSYDVEVTPPPKGSNTLFSQSDRQTVRSRGDLGTLGSDGSDRLTEKGAYREVIEEPLLGDYVHSGMLWLGDPQNLDDDRWAPLDKFTEVVGGPETVQHMLRESLIELQPSRPNLVRLVRR